MMITLEVPGEMAARLRLEAGRQGLSLDEFMLRAALVQIGKASAVPAAASFDPYLAAAGERNRAAAEELTRLGITDCEGNRLKSGIPEDMKAGSGRDFGG